MYIPKQQGESTHHIKLQNLVRVTHLIYTFFLYITICLSCRLYFDTFSMRNVKDTHSRARPCTSQTDISDKKTIAKSESDRFQIDIGIRIAHLVQLKFAQRWYCRPDVGPTLTKLSVLS